ncbi:MAG: hypothetical protein ACK55I_40705, partial [bacterium]
MGESAVSRSWPRTTTASTRRCSAPDAGTGATSVCRRVTCGDGVVEGAEACDDNDATGGDGCSATCTIEPGFVCG